MHGCIAQLDVLTTNHVLLEGNLSIMNTSPFNILTIVHATYGHDKDLAPSWIRVKDLNQQSQTLVQHVDPHMCESEGDQLSMQQLVALHRPKKHNSNGVFQRTNHRIFCYVKGKVVNRQICAC
jgi:hypothetical protein